MNLSIILDTCPEIIKMSPVIRECERRGLEYFIPHTGQHYSCNMDRVFFEQLRLPPRFAIMRHDIDRRAGSALDTARIEQEFGIRY